MECGAENSGRDASWVRSGFQEVFGEMWVGFSVGRKGEVAGGLGEIGGRILGCSWGVSGSGSLWKEEPEVGCFSVNFRGRTGLSLAGDSLECLLLSSGINLGLFSSPFPLKRTLISPPFSL